MKVFMQMWKQWRKPNRLLLLYFISYVLVILLPVISIGYFSYRLALYTAEEEISRSHINSLRYTGTTFDETLRKINSLTVAIGFDSRLNSYSANMDNRYLLNEVQDMLKQSVASDRKIHSVQLFFESGGQIISSDVLVHDYQGDHDDRWVDMIRQSEQDSLWLSPELIRNYDGHEESIITFIRKVPFGSRNKVGYVAIHLFERQLQGQLKQMQNMDNMNTYMVSAAGEIITSFRQADVSTGVTRMHLERVASLQGEGFFTDNHDHPSSLVAYSSTLWNGWRLVSQTPLTNIYEKLSYIGRLTFGFCVLLSIVGIAVSFWLSRKMYDPIKQLMERTRSYMSELELKDSSKHGNELSQVSDVLETAVGQKKLMDQQFRQQVPVMLDRFAMALLQHRLSDTEIRDRIEQYRLELSLRGYVVIVIELDYAAELAQRFTNKDMNLYQYAIANIVSELIQTKTHYKFVMTDISEYQQAVVMNVFDMMEAEELRDLAQHIQQVIGDVLKLSVSIGLGSVYANIMEAHVSFQEALQVLKTKLLQGAKSVLIFETAGEMETGYYSFLQTGKQMTNNLKVGNTKEALAILEGLKQEIALKQLSPELVYIAYNRLLETGIETLLEHNGNPQELFGHDTVLHRELAQLETIDDINLWMTTIIVKISTYIQEQDNKNNKTVDKVTSYINLHYPEDLSVEMIAEGVGFNASYLSRMFKQHTGRTILENLTLKRMEQSKQLLLETAMNLHDISMAVGYNNVNSYIRFFKKLEGITPGEYRKQRTGN
ncbi:hypothetical protein BK127_29105 [Paenibacillus sp. FSL H7-0331]|nr:hypothetical protein BK127_29105 [Paenibacillus sp. FSL H7-0331]